MIKFDDELMILHDTFGLQCKHKSELPVRRKFENGTVHYGKQCATCGRWQAAKKASFATLPETWFDTAIGDSFAELKNFFWMQRVDHERHQREAFEDRFPFEDWRERYEAYLDSDEWKEKRQKVLNEEPVCSMCKKSPSIHVHHNSYARLGYEWRRDLTALCYDCHAIHHKHMKIICLNWSNWS